MLVRLLTSRFADTLSSLEWRPGKWWSPYDKLTATHYDLWNDRMEKTPAMAYNLWKEKLERIVIHPVAPWWEPPAVTIITNADEAIKYHDLATAVSIPETLEFYTDGSGIDGKIGAASVLVAKHLANPITSYSNLHSDRTSTVYMGELRGTSMALQQAHDWASTGGVSRVRLWTDNQAAIRSYRQPGTSAGQGILLEGIELYDRLKRLGVTVEINWCPAHKGVEGNELADKAAKKAAQAPYPQHIYGGSKFTKTSLKAMYNRYVKHEWTDQWQNNDHGRALFRFLKEPDAKVKEVFNGLSKPECAILMQMVTEKIGLKNFLFNIKREDTPSCDCGAGRQTALHILRDCPNYSDLRMQYLGRKQFDFRQLLREHDIAKRAAHFMYHTGLLGQFQHVNRAEMEVSDASTA